jgi:hypothetical protein
MIEKAAKATHARRIRLLPATFPRQMAKMKLQENITSRRAKCLQREGLGRLAARVLSAVIERLTVHRSKMAHGRDDRGPVATPAGHFCRYLRTVR